MITAFNAIDEVTIVQAAYGRNNGYDEFWSTMDERERATIDDLSKFLIGSTSKEVSLLLLTERLTDNTSVCIARVSDEQE